MIKILLITLLLSTPLFSEEPTESQEIGDTQNDSYHNITERKENAEDTKLGQLEQLTQDPQFEPVLAACVQEKASNPNTYDHATCINDAFLGEGTFSKAAVHEDVRIELSKKYLSSGDMENRYDSADLGTMQEQYNDPALDVIKKHLYERLQEALYGEITEGQKDKPIKTVDHKLFYELYKSQISKNIILALTSYCYDSDLNNDFIIDPDPTKIATINATNKAMLSQTTDPTNGNLLTDSKGNATTLAAKKWTECIGTIPDICHKEDYYANTTFTNETKKHTQQRACEVTGYLKDLRQNLMRLTEIETSIKDQSHKGLSLGMEKPVIVNTGKGTDSQKSIDEMTSITSGEIKDITDKKEYTSAIDNASEEAARCKKSGDINDPACQKYLISEDNQQKIDQANAEYGARVAAMKTKLEGMDEAGLKAYLADEGRTEDEIKNLIENSDLKKLKSDIAEKYANEKKAIIARMNERLHGRTIAATNSNANPNSVMDKIESELQSRATDYTQLIHFNNIISGYLSVGKDGDRNVASVNREMDSSAFTDDQQEHELLQSAVEDTLDSSVSGVNDIVNVDIQTINEKILTSTITP